MKTAVVIDHAQDTMYMCVRMVLSQIFHFKNLIVQKTNLVRLIFIVVAAYENFYTGKISQTTVLQQVPMMRKSI